MPQGKIVLDINDEFIADMRKQKRVILILLASKLIPQESINELEGTLNLFDHIQDTAIDELGFDKNAVLDSPPDEDENPEGYKAHTAAFENEVKRLDDNIITTYQEKF